MYSRVGISVSSVCLIFGATALPRVFCLCTHSDPSRSLFNELGTCHAHAYRGQGRMLAVFLFHSSFYSFKEGYLTKLKVYPFQINWKASQPTSQQALGIYFSLPSQCWGYRHIQSHRNFMWMLKIQTKCFHACTNTLHTLSHPDKPEAALSSLLCGALSHDKLFH